ncbi:hypothetical protein [Armatimonas rosea]|uniref:Uncharacterized protein n=1 Tax=Armatimonas rosea TaxID=685828 RepID=A0A7W9SPP0_ARMRO|nr:hypothetical protein [Armatimonas rosea]MBB6049914.1 hypothetical protein [Armatimonas rosea]
MARFCSICGAAVTAATPPPVSAATSAARPQPAARPQQPQPTVYGQPQGASYGQPMATAQPANANGLNKAGLAALIAGIVLVGAAGFLFAKSSGVLNAQKPVAPQGAVINAPNTQPAQAPVLSAPQPTLPNAPILKPPAMVGNPMPADVIAWLRWLKWFEGERKRLEAKSAGELIVQLQNAIKEYMTGESLGLLDGSFESGEKPKKPAPNYGEQIAKVIGEWNQAANVYKTPGAANKPPLPDTCAPLASGYGEALDAGIAEMSKLMNTLNATLGSMGGQNGDTSGAQNAVRDLMAQKSSKSASKSVDALFSDANAALDAVRNRYTEIPSDIDSSHFRIVSEGASLSLPIMGM